MTLLFFDTAARHYHQCVLQFATLPFFWEPDPPVFWEDFEVYESILFLLICCWSWQCSGPYLSPTMPTHLLPSLSPIGALSADHHMYTASLHLPIIFTLSCLLSSLWLFGTSFGTDLLFSNFLNFYSSLGIDHDPPCSLCSHDLWLFLSHMFHLSHDHMA